MATAISGISLVKPVEQIRELEEKIIDIIGKKKFEILCETDIKRNLHLVATPFKLAIEVEEGMKFAALMVELEQVKLASELNSIFERIFSLKYKVTDQKAFEELKDRFFEEMQNQILATLKDQYDKALRSTCYDAVRTRDFVWLLNLRKLGQPWGNNILAVAKSQVNDPGASENAKEVSKEIENWIEAQLDLEEMGKLEDKLLEMTQDDLIEMFKYMYFSIAGMAITFVEEDKSYLFSDFTEAIKDNWRMTRIYPILESCFNRALLTYGKAGQPEWIGHKNTRLKQIRMNVISGLRSGIERLKPL